MERGIECGVAGAAGDENRVARRDAGLSKSKRRRPSRTIAAIHRANNGEGGLCSAGVFLNGPVPALGSREKLEAEGVRPRASWIKTRFVVVEVIGKHHPAHRLRDATTTTRRR